MLKYLIFYLFYLLKGFQGCIMATNFTENRISEQGLDSSSYCLYQYWIIPEKGMNSALPVFYPFTCYSIEYNDYR